MFEHCVENQRGKAVIGDEQLNRFIDLYERFVNDTDTNKLRMARFRWRAESEWRRIPRGMRNAVAVALVKRGLLPVEVCDVLYVFKGTIVNII